MVIRRGNSARKKGTLRALCHAPRPLHLQSLKLQLHVVQCTIPPRPLTPPAFQASRSWSPIVKMDDLPPLPSSAAPSRASSRQSSSPGLSESHLYIRDFVRETRQRLNFTSVQLPILDDTQLSELSDGETILLPLCCSALNALASMTRQLDIVFVTGRGGFSLARPRPYTGPGGVFLG